MLHSIYQQIWKTQQWPQDWKRLVFIPIPKKGNGKECSNYHIIALILHASKFICKFLQTRLKQCMNQKLLAGQAGFTKRQRNQRWNCQYSLDHREIKGIPEKYLLHLCERLWLCRSQQTVENSKRDRNTRPSYLSPEKPICKSRRNS